MAKKFWLMMSLALLIPGICLFQQARAAATQNDKLLTPADVAKISGIAGIKTVPKNPAKSAGGDLNFAKPNNELVLMAIFQTVDPKDLAKNCQTKSFRDVYVGPVTPGVGDAAYESPAQGERTVLTFLKGNHWVTLGTYFNPMTMKPLLSQKQLRELAAIIIANGKW